MLQPTFSITTVEERDDFARLVIEPLEKGYGHTMGVSLRRVLLTSIEGAAVTSLMIDGVQHQYSTLEGLKEDIVEFVLNTKLLHFTFEDSTTEEVKATLSAKGPATVTAADIQLPAGVKLSNPNLELATLTESSAKLDVEFTITRGRGYHLADEQQEGGLGVIPVDASFSPIIKVAYKVEATRVGRRTDFDKLIMDVWTTGGVKPEDALRKAAQILVDHFKQVVDPVIVEKPVVESYEDKIEDEVFRLTVEELDLPTRIANALRKGGYETVKDLTQAKRDEIAKVKNLGEKSIDTVVEALEKKGVSITG